MHKDQYGMELTAASAKAVRHFDDTLDAYLRFGRDTGQHLKATLTEDPEMPMALITRGIFFKLFCDLPFEERARKSLAAAHSAIEKHGATRREQLHFSALDAWCRGDMARAVHHFEELLIDDPLDVLAIRLAHFIHFYLGDSQAMRDSVARVMPAWDESLPAYGYILGVYAFGLEEAGRYSRAEDLGHRAVALNADDIWAVHAVAHVLEMGGRQRDGIAWLGRPDPVWDKANNFRYHVWWHLCLYHLDLKQYDAVLELYDTRVRGDRDSEEYLDMVNGAAMLWRLENAGIDVGERWVELADKAMRRIDDHLLAFVDAHLMLALAADGRAVAVETMQGSLREAAGGGDTQALVIRDVGRPLAEGIAALYRGEHDKAVDLMWPIRGEFRRVGGSHAQRDLFDRMLVDAALAAGRYKLARAMLADRIALKHASPWNWDRMAEALAALGDADGAEAARTESAALST